MGGVSSPDLKSTAVLTEEPLSALQWVLVLVSVFLCACLDRWVC